ncbi:hypothetical protein AQI70_20050 [Streptomyces curacoi]|uniref:Uncharacterized protein n=1 Tax=Streptomyces curacoi TaxID=146536 RepID=A0A117P6Z5_9ACTN|nr:hypothetical protein AQI70_20050 [Streptomyces curacoi]
MSAGLSVPSSTRLPGDRPAAAVGRETAVDVEVGEVGEVVELRELAVEIARGVRRLSRSGRRRCAALGERPVRRGPGEPLVTS